MTFKFFFVCNENFFVCLTKKMLLKKNFSSFDQEIFFVCENRFFGCENQIFGCQKIYPEFLSFSSLSNADGKNFEF